MTQVLSKLSPKQTYKVSRLVIATSVSVIGCWTYLVIRSYASSTKQTKKVCGDQKPKASHLKRPDMRLTLKQLKIILNSIVTYKEIFLALGMSVGLVLRTILDLYQINNGTEIEKAIIIGNSKELLVPIISYSASMPLLAFVNNFIRYSGDNLSLNLRIKLSHLLYEKYMTNMTFYKLSQQNSKLNNVDQLLTADVDKFCISLVQLYNNFTKPLLDIIILVKKLSSTYTGFQTPGIMMAYLAFAGCVLTQARKSLSQHVINETQCEGQLRYVHSRLLQNSEEISFYRGNKKELVNLKDSLKNLQDALSDLILFKFKIGFFDNIVGRYISTLVGYFAIAIPFFSPLYKDVSNEDRLGYYYVAGRMMVKLAESIQRMIVASNDLTKLSAYTQRVQALLDCVNQPMEQSTSNSDILPIENETASILECDHESPMISFKNATISTPNGDILIKDITLTIKQHQNVLICGPNGSGKSSVFRVLAGLWQVESGQVIKPPAEQLFYICQKPYMTLGTFRDQIIYPDTQEDMKLKGYTDDNLIEILQTVFLDYLLDRDLDFNTVADFQDTLSGGEKQRIALARVMYHKPQFAILDECTSAVSIDVEQKIYQKLTSLDITLLSVTHRIKQLHSFHHFILQLDRDGSYQFKRIEHEDI